MTQFQARCRTESCSAPITWAVVAKSGKGVPLDAEPNDEGMVYVVGEQEDGRPLVAYATPEHPPPESAERFTSHFQTCPAAAEWSKAKNIGKQKSKKAAKR